MASIQRKNRLYYLVRPHPETGKQQWTPTGQTTEREAWVVANDILKLEEKIQSEQRGKEAVLNFAKKRYEEIHQKTLNLPTVGSVYQDKLEQYRQKCKASTFPQYESIFKRWIKFSEKRHNDLISSLCTVDFEDYQKYLSELGLSAKTVNKSIVMLGVPLKDLVKQGILSYAPTNGVKPLEVSDSETREPFTDAEVKKILKETEGTDWFGAVLVSFWTGGRLNSVCNITSDKVNLKKGSILIYEPKTEEEFEHALSLELLDFLKGLKVADKTPLFPKLYGRESGKAGGLSNEFGRILEKAGIEIPKGKKKTGKGRQFSKKSFHSLRHSFVSRLRGAGIDKDLSMKMVGHTDEQVHDEYTHHSFENQKAAISKLSPVMG